MGRALSRYFEFRLLFVHARVYSEPERRLYDVILNVVICEFSFMLPQISVLL